MALGKVLNLPKPIPHLESVLNFESYLRAAGVETPRTVLGKHSKAPVVTVIDINIIVHIKMMETGNENKFRFLVWT